MQKLAFTSVAHLWDIVFHGTKTIATLLAFYEVKSSGKWEEKVPLE